MSDKDYKIPNEIKSCIPDHFYYALAGELVSIFGHFILQPLDFSVYDDDGVRIANKDNTDTEPVYDLNLSTNGGSLAFFATCEKLHMMWLYDYWNALDWDQGDLFDGEIEEEIVNRVLKGDNNSFNPYFEYLRGKKRS